MKAWHPIFFVLFAVAAGEALPPDAVPVMCAAICGPIVELSSMCSPKRSLGNIGSNRLDREAHPKQARKHDGERVEESEKIEKRFSVIVPAPTTFPPDLLVDQYPLASPPMSETSVLPSQSPAPIPPPTYSPPAQPPPVSALPTTADNLPWSNAQAGPPSPTPSTTSNIHSSVSSVGTKTGTKPPTTSSHHTSTTPTIIGSNGKDGDETRGWGETENAEEECVCLNHSFNVAEIAGLCASCISMIADTQNGEDSPFIPLSSLEANQSVKIWRSSCPYVTSRRSNIAQTRIAWRATSGSRLPDRLLEAR